MRSDFQREAWAAQPPAHAAAPKARAPAAPQSRHAGHTPTASDIAALPFVHDRGIAITNYLLTKHIRHGARPETYDTTCISLQRHDVGHDALAGDAGEAGACVDVFEMYWADLSRLSGSMPRIISELFTLVFRLSKLGRGTVDEMWGQLARARDPGARWAGMYKGAWNVVAVLQIALDWLFVNGLSLLFTQLALLGIVLACLGFTAGVVPDSTSSTVTGIRESWLHHGVAVALCILAFLRLVYRRGDGKPLQALVPIAVFGVAAGVLVFAPAQLQWITALALLVVLTGVNEFVLRIADDRFPLVHVIGRWMWCASAVLMLGGAIHETQLLGAVQWRDLWVHAALFATETVLLLLKWWWIVAGPLLVAWFVAGQVARTESGYASRASVATGRLGITVSFGMFLAVTMTVWALVNNVLDASADGVGYRPCIFAFEPSASAPRPAAVEPNTCVVAQQERRARWRGRGHARRARRDATTATVRSTSAFALLATLLLMLVAYLLAMFTPSVLAELKLIVDSQRDAHQQAVDKRHPVHARATLHQRTQHARALGRWLTAGYRRLDLVVGGVSLLGVVLSLGIAALFLTTVFEHDAVKQHGWQVGLGGIVAWLAGREGAVSGLSQGLFDPLQAAVFSAAGVGAALSVLGGQLSRHIPSLRGPLDVAMDVDNHFREFPRTNIPRAHIFSRYAALLTHLQTQGYDRIVVVAHSQGTVISAELLRFLASDGRHAPQPGARPRLPHGTLPPLQLLTLGCPLRQLYAARFPGLYAWVLANNGHVFGPRAADIGAARWMNAFCSGDYVGRWLWSNAAHDACADRIPTVNAGGPRPVRARRRLRRLQSEPAGRGPAAPGARGRGVPGAGRPYPLLRAGPDDGCLDDRLPGAGASARRCPRGGRRRRARRDGGCRRRPAGARGRRGRRRRGGRHRRRPRPPRRRTRRRLEWARRARVLPCRSVPPSPITATLDPDARQGHVHEDRTNHQAGRARRGCHARRLLDHRQRHLAQRKPRQRHVGDAPRRGLRLPGDARSPLRQHPGQPRTGRQGARRAGVPARDLGRPGAGRRLRRRPVARARPRRRLLPHDHRLGGLADRRAIALAGVPVHDGGRAQSLP